MLLRLVEIMTITGWEIALHLQMDDDSLTMSSGWQIRLRWLRLLAMGVEGSRDVAANDKAHDQLECDGDEGACGRR